MTFGPADELPHAEKIDEWVFAAWQPRGDLGVVSGHRLLGRRSWYWCAFVEADRPLLHLTEWQVIVRAVDPFIVKAPEMWAEHQVDAPMEQWSIGNEAYFVALDDPSDALARAYGKPTPVAMDLEWYATDDASPIDDGYEQPGVVHGEIELLHRPNLHLVETPAHRWRRWGSTLAPLHAAGADDARSDSSRGWSLRAPFAFPDGTSVEWVLTETGWRSDPIDTGH